MDIDIIGKPTDEDLQAYCFIHLTDFHEWDHSVLDHIILFRMGSRHGIQVQMISFSLTLILMDLAVTPLGLLKNLAFWVNLCNHPPTFRLVIPASMPLTPKCPIIKTLGLILVR